ncbi:alpha/beta fold hydrolase [Streptomyces sp. NPDC093510]|uniref:thioesterase II family protein n=1 Tax=Streptomyces sp. NPDC093510 TaxID=3155199 RepID=UPI00342DE321
MIGETSVRLFCLPYAGGSARVYQRWSDAVGPRFPVSAVELPGHGRRIREPLHTSADSLMDLLLSELTGQLGAGPYALFGHSMGGRLAFQLAHECVRRGLPRPVQLFLSAARSPAADMTTHRLHDLPDTELLTALGTLGGSPAETLAHSELMAVMLPVLRADLRLAESWSFRPEHPLDIPVSLFSGLADPLASRTEVERWRDFFSSQACHRSYHGDHFFPFPAADKAVPMLSDLKDALTRALNATSGPAATPIAPRASRRRDTTRSNIELRERHEDCVF